MVDLVPATDVLEPVGEVGEVSRAVLAFEGSQAGMDVTMLAELGTAQEALVAFGADEWAVGFGRVHGGMDLQTSFRFVALSAAFTLIGANFRVKELMPLQVRFLKERLIALLAGKWPLIVRQVVLLPMVNKVYLLHEGFIAVFAPEAGPIDGVDLPVGVQTACGEEFTTVWAFDHLLWDRVNLPNVHTDFCLGAEYGIATVTVDWDVFGLLS